MSSRAGHPVRQGPMQSPAWSESSSSSEVLRAARTSSESVITAIPSAAGVAQEGQRLGRPSIFTAHRKQEADGSKPSTWQSVGMARPSLRAAPEWSGPRRSTVETVACAPVEWMRACGTILVLIRLPPPHTDTPAGTSRSACTCPGQSRAAHRASSGWRRPGNAGRKSCSRCSSPARDT